MYMVKECSSEQFVIILKRLYSLHTYMYVCTGMYIYLLCWRHNKEVAEAVFTILYIIYMYNMCGTVVHVHTYTK